MSSKRDNQELMRAYTLLGQQVARTHKELAETACMNPDVREIVAFIDAYNVLNGTTDYQIERAALIILGRETWLKKELTELALLVGDPTKYGSFYPTKPTT